MPSSPINFVASALNFGNCKTVISCTASIIQDYTAMRYRRRSGIPKYLNAPDTLGPMRVSTIALLCLALFAAAAQQKARKPADVQILETKAVREAAKISVDGKVRVTGEKLHGLVIVFDFRSPEKEVVTSQKAVIDEDTLEAGREGVFHSEMADSARAVRYTVRAFDNHEKELRVANPGPYPVE